MSKLWISAAVVLVVVGTATSVVLMEEVPQAPPEPRSATKPVPNKPASSTLTAPTPDVARVSPPQPQATAERQQQAELQLWDPQSLVASEHNGIPVHETQVAPELLQGIGLGQTLSLPVPGRQQPVRATLSETRNNGGAAVWHGKLLDGQDTDSLTLVRGAVETHITVATLEGTLSMIIDNATGKTVITDENEMVLRANPNDTMPFDARELPPLAPPAQG
ncbi:hypothetical protein SAMN05878276_0150 [Aquipseudomonas alcaligenes]|uniref:hypothetical protein n=1 Tax=Aquipseudomonas alcaligenes TaxID=43263 RepID=UPI000953C65A|nr:hypothetical protein [Pseudomonas alcaligenes]SIR79106.1 hypothetical protein SAMN05878276_0150 [Pseudomonas alcaligenes]